MTEATDVNEARDVIEWRRDFHRNPELGFREFRTASVIAAELERLGFLVRVGLEAADPAAFLDIPATLVERAYSTAELELGASARLDAMRGGLTSVVADMGQGSPRIGIRFDMDALPMHEAADSDHRPHRDGFDSCIAGQMHACGHDGHSAIGLALAARLAARGSENGMVRLIFQGAEEGAPGGAASIVSRGLVDDLDDVVCFHLGLGVPTGALFARSKLVATSKFRVVFEGRPAHVVNAPQDGRNALLAAATAALALHAIAPHSEGWLSVNVGKLSAGVEQGVTAPIATMEFGIWASRADVLAYARDRAEHALAGAAATWGVDYEVHMIGTIPFASQDPELAALFISVARRTAGIAEAGDEFDPRAADDGVVLLERVAARGGRGIFATIGSALASGHHTERFDFDERALLIAVDLFDSLILALRSEQDRDSGVPVANG